MTLSLVTIDGQNIEDLRSARARSITQKSVAEGVGRQLRERRIFCGVSKDELAERLQIDPADVKGYEEGKKRISANLLLRVAKLLDVRPTYFFSCSDDRRHVIANVDKDRSEGTAGEMIVFDDEMRVHRALNQINSAALREALTTIADTLAENQHTG